MSQEAQILAHLRRGPITPQTALNLYGCFRLAARISDLRDKGFWIETQMVKEGDKRYARYWLKRGRNNGK